MLPLDAVLACLPPRQEQLLRMQYGIGEDSGYPFEEVARRFAITPARAEKLQAQAVARLCSPLSYRRLVGRIRDPVEARFTCLHLSLGIHAFHARASFSCPPDCVSSLFSVFLDFCPPVSPADSG